MFIDEMTLKISAGNGGDGVVRWRHDKFVPMAGPAGGDGGNGGDVYIEAIADTTYLRNYSGKTHFTAEHGHDGERSSRFGKNGSDFVLYVPTGSVVTDLDRDRTYELYQTGERVCILRGGRGGFGNEHFKSSTNRSPEESTKGRRGEEGTFSIAVTLAVDVGLVGLPNAGKSSILNALTNAKSRIGDYPFTTTEPHLGDFHHFIIADIPGLIEGAAEGKGLGHKFLRHISRTKMLLHVLSAETADAGNDYQTILDEMSRYSNDLITKEQWLIVTKIDLINKEDIPGIQLLLDKVQNRVFFVSTKTGEGVKDMRDALVEHLRQTYNATHN
jgi:GTPase